jgi:AcrR family transcriptional regulator
VTDTTRRGPYAKGVAKRSEILREALAAYAESDSSGPSLRAVAARVGLSERGLLHYFSSRDELLVAVLRARDVADLQLVEAATTLDDLAAVQARSSRTPGLVRLFLEMAAAAPDPAHAAHRFFLDRYERLRDRIRVLFAATVQDAEGRAPDPKDAAFAARILIAASDGLQAQWLLDPSIDMEEDLRQLARALRAQASGGES